MTQEETLKKFDESTGWFKDHPFDILHIARAEFVEYINKLESRSCENCVFCDETRDVIIHCMKFEQYMPIEIGKCDKWEQKWLTI